MPVIIAREQFSCGDGLETRHREGDGGDVVQMETLLSQVRCLQCICQELLDLMIDGLSCAPPSQATELEAHFKVLEEGLKGDMAKQVLASLKAKALKPANAEEFRSGVLGLGGVPLISSRFIARP
ncbi:hypothetical protein DL770_000031 [Monosporascus sp. CRB-9-2]|nr:hypothetical protein DL770_000031 [Monosporascus sp. CRB-9-2]